MKWEDICNHCGDCCEVGQSGFGCPLYNTDTNRCSDYCNRHQRVPHCRQLTPDNVERLHKNGVLSDRCNYVRLARGQELIWDVEPVRLRPYEEAPLALKLIVERK